MKKSIYYVVVVLCAFVLGCAPAPGPAPSPMPKPVPAPAPPPAPLLTPGNQPPTIASLTANPSMVSPGGTSTITCFASDPDGDSLSYTWSATGSITGTGNWVTWTAPSTPGSYTITVTVNDGKGGVVTQTFVVSVVTVITPNQPPVITSVTANPSTVSPAGTSTIRCFASDPDGDSLWYSWSATGGSLSGTGNLVTWIAPSTAGSYTIMVTVNDGRGGVVIGTFVAGVVTVITTNQPPVITSVTANPSTVSPGGTSTITCVASDADGDSLSYTWSPTAGGVTGTGNLVTWTAPSTPGSYTISLTVDDGRGGTTTGSCVFNVVTVITPNQPPVITSVTANPSTVSPGGTSTITCVASDPDGDSLSYTWSKTGGGITGTEKRVTWTAPSTPGSYTITVTVNDGKGGTTTGSCVVGVVANRPPVITIVKANPSSVSPGGTSTITCFASDADGDSLSYTWLATGGSITITRTRGQVTWTAPSRLPFPGITLRYTITVTVKDGKGGTTTGSCVVSVS